VFAALFLLCIGLAMVAGALRGLRRGRVMTLTRAPGRREEQWARRGEGGFWPYVALWLGGGAVVLYHAVRLLLLALG